MDEQHDHWRCPDCGCVQHIKAGGNGSMVEPCEDCGERSEPADWTVCWEEFWRFCQKLKT